MKQIVLASIVLLSAFFTSCTKSNLVVEPDGANTLRAVMENSDGGRTTLDDGRNVIWSAGDELSVFNPADQQKAKYTLIQGEGTTSAVFQSNKPLGEGVKYAFYPASDGVTCAADVISFDLPATQAYAKASFANGSNPMVAKSNAQGDLSFNNLCGVIKFQLTGTKTVAKVVMQTAGEVVAGAMTVNMGYTDAPAMEVATTGPTSITLTDCNVSLSESVNSTFYFTVPAGTYAAGLRFTAYNSANEVIRTKATSAPLTVLRSHIASLPGTSENLYFPDPNFRAKLVSLGFEETADKTDIDITNPVNAGKLKDKTLNVGNITTNAVSKAAAAKPMISSLKGIEYFTELTSLDCDGNSLTALDVSANKKLTKLLCEHNLLSVLDISKNKALQTLGCTNNKLETLDVSQNTALTALDCSDNQLKALDVSQNTVLATLKCSENQLKALDIRATPSLTTLVCGEQTSDGTTKQDISLSLTAKQKTDGLATGTGVTTVNFPDVAFRTKLVALGFALNTDQTDIDITNSTNANLLATLQWPDLSSANITDLTGIEHFTELTSLLCMNNKLTELNLSKNTKLKYVYCNVNKLTKLDVSTLKVLEELECYDNTLTDLKVNGVTTLTKIDCNNNQLKTLDVNGCTALTELRCNTNLLTGLTLNTALATLDCHDNQLNTLNVSGCSVLTKLYCHKNKLTTLTLNTALTTLHCYDNTLNALDVSKNGELKELNCSGNNFTNGLDVSQNTKLNVLECNNDKLNALTLPESEALRVLNCSGNTLNALVVSNNTKLEYLHCQNNKLTELTLTTNKALSTLHCQNNQLAKLILTNNDKVEYLFCYGNRMSALNISDLTSLTALQCGLQTTNGTTAQDLTLTLTQAQSDKSLSIGTNNDRVKDNIPIKL